MIRPIDIRLNAAHPDLPLAEAVTYTGAPSTVLIRGVPGNCGRWAITAVFVAVTFPDGSTSTRTAVQSANGVWVATLPATATSGRTAHGLRILADGADEYGEAVGGYVLGVADFAVASLGISPAPQPGETSWQMLYFDAVPGVLRKGDVTKIDGTLKLYNGTAWEAFDERAYVTAARAQQKADLATVKADDAGRAAARAQAVAEAATATATDAQGAAATAQGLITAHAADTTIHVTSTEKATWNGKQDALTTQQLANIAAVPSKANDADVVHKTGDETIAGVKTFSSNIYADGGIDVPWIYIYQLRIITNTGEVYVPDAESGTLALTANIPYTLTTKTISNNAVTLDDRAMNAVAVSSALASLTVNFPTATSGKVRDFGLRLSVASGITTAPELVLPQGVTCENADGEVPEIGADGAATILYFTETASGVFLVKGEVVTAIS